MKGMTTSCNVEEHKSGRVDLVIRVMNCKDVAEAHRIGESLARPVIAVLEEIRGIKAEPADDRTRALMREQ